MEKVNKKAMVEMQGLLEQLKSCDCACVMIWGKDKDSTELKVDMLFQHNLNHLETMGLLQCMQHGIHNKLAADEGMKTVHEIFRGLR